MVLSYNGFFVKVYDSLYNGILKEDLKDQLRALYSNNQQLHVEVQQQQGSSDCGLFVIPYLLSLASGSDSVKHKYRQSDMRSHFLTCLKEKSPFPLERTMTQVARPDIHII